MGVAMHFQLQYIVEPDNTDKVVLKLIEENLPTIQQERVLAAISSELDRIKVEAGQGMHLFLLTIQLSATDTFTPSLLKKHDEHE